MKKLYIQLSIEIQNNLIVKKITKNKDKNPKRNDIEKGIRNDKLIFFQITLHI